MASVYANGKGTSAECIASASKAAAIGAAYKTVPVREAATALLEAMATSLGLADVQRAVQGVSDNNLRKAATDALAKVTAAAGGALSAPPSQASAMGARAPAPRTGSRPSTASSSKVPPRPGSAGAVSRPGTASSGVNRGLSTSSSVLSRPGTASPAASAGAAASVGGADGPLLALDKNKDERAKKVGPKLAHPQIFIACAVPFPALCLMCTPPSQHATACRIASGLHKKVTMLNFQLYLLWYRQKFGLSSSNPLQERVFF
jgi:hypothetical protein